MKDWMKKFYAHLLYANLIWSIQTKNHIWFSENMEDIKRSKNDVKCNVFKLVKTNYQDDLNRLDPESAALLLDFMKKCNIINDKEETISL